MGKARSDLKQAFEAGPTVFQALAAQRTHRVFKGFSKDITRPRCVDAAKAVVRYCFDKWGRYPVYFSDFQNSFFMVEVGVVDERFYDEKNLPGFVNGRIRERSTRRRRVRRAA